MNEFEALTAAAENIADRNVRLRTFVQRLTDPEDLGWAVSHEVRKLAGEIMYDTKPTCPPCTHSCRQGRDCPARYPEKTA